ncbi:hypothetical protein [uncultured Pseudomonas sp.]|uniref:hypothetical protein n=1 Tax=uncultured Pseudomonas sp. TaxID=114707 RepID=UPI0025E29D81|nr:hypothetical protein [uncultured Pseudomonas sp.]
MTDETQALDGLDDEIRKLTYDDFVEFLNTAGATACEACGADEWGISMEEGSDSLLSIGQIVSVRKPSSSVWLLHTTCQRCGNMRIFNANRITKWVLNGKPEIQQDAQ